MSSGTESPVEEAGYEPSVPVIIEHYFRRCGGLKPPPNLLRSEPRTQNEALVWAISDRADIADRSCVHRGWCSLQLLFCWASHSKQPPPHWARIGCTPRRRSA